MLENSYGFAKRFDFVASVIASRYPARVLDIGCGTGANLTVPLARRFADVDFVGVDSDVASIGFAQREYRTGNLHFLVDQDAGELGSFDMIIASEVIEHVEDPDAFLAFLRSRLAPDGCIVLTLPNGLGPSEFASLLGTLLHLSGIYALLRALKHRLLGRPAPQVLDTLAVSPHINFFSYRQLQALLASNGFAIQDYRPRTLFCGFGFDHLMMNSPRLIAWNARSADLVPPQMVSGWMFVLVATEAPGAPVYRRGSYARLRRYLNEKRWCIR